MKLTAAIFLIIFTLVQAVPAIQSFSPDVKVSLFNPDEEKSEKGSTEKSEKKESKDCSFSLTDPASIRIQGLSFNADAVTLHPSPCLETHTPPPNYA